MIYHILLLPCAWAQEAFQIQNGIDAQRLDNSKGSNVAGSPCSGSDVVCIGDQVGQCVNGILTVVSPCSGGLSCQVLPLVNKPGTSVSCTTEADKLARLAAAGVNGASSPSLAPITTSSSTVSSPVVSSSPSSSGTNKQGDFVCIDDTRFMQFTSATDFVINSCPPGFCFTRTPPFKNPCVGKANAQRIDKTLRKRDLASIRIQNAQEAVQGNIDKFQVKIGDTCAPEGVVKCLGVMSVMCTNATIVGPVTVCPSGQECAVLPNVNQPGTVQRCNPLNDTESRIQLGLQGLS